MRDKIVIYNGDRYLVYKCRNCRNEMRIKVNGHGSVHVSGICPQCGKDFITTLKV